MSAMPENMTLRAIAAGEEGALARLFQLYCYDNAAWSGEDVLADGRYDVCDAGLAEYVHAPGHTAHWIEVDGALAGFYVTEPGMAGELAVREFSDFFILKKYRRRGLALEVVRRVLLDSAQTWLVATFRADADACAFWRQAFARLPFARVEPWDDPALPQFQLTLLKPAA
ncbi:GNAT family N-acetyltransferase [Janthinobacterium sp. JC611]|uniref:GNAT family N-acetyltransferase n=1 Tax=Janthinobacterium sp. JC611 TaxID=2816201 RepID=UPI001BFDEB2D|nr:GNAT family N-acetyltransferase [Janthinobacterium sp. JC611]